MSVQSYRDLIAWQKAMDLAAQVYELTEKFPTSERYGLVAQLRRAAISVPSSIAEGQGRLSTGEFLQFLGHARGSLLEVETQILLSVRLGYCSAQSAEQLLESCATTARVVNGLINSLGGNKRPRQKPTTDH